MTGSQSSRVRVKVSDLAPATLFDFERWRAGRLGRQKGGTDVESAPA